MVRSSLNAKLAVCMALMAGLSAACGTNAPAGTSPAAATKVCDGPITPLMKRADADGPVVVSVGDGVMTVAEMERRIKAQPPSTQKRLAEKAQLERFAQTQLRFELLAHEAIARGYHLDDEVQATLKKLIVQKLTRTAFNDKTKADALDDAALKTWFDAHPTAFDKPEMLRASMIFIPFGADKAASKAKAEAVHKKAADPRLMHDRKAFAALVMSHSQDEASKRTSGDLRYLGRPDYERRVGKAGADTLFALGKVDTVGPLLTGVDGYYIFKKTGHRGAIKRPFEQVKQQIRSRLFRERRLAAFDAFIDTLKTKHKGAIDQDALGKVKLSAPGAVVERDNAGHAVQGGHDGHGHEGHH